MGKRRKRRRRGMITVTVMVMTGSDKIVRNRSEDTIVMMIENRLKKNQGKKWTEMDQEEMKMGEKMNEIDLEIEKGRETGLGRDAGEKERGQEIGRTEEGDLAARI